MWYWLNQKKKGTNCPSRKAIPDVMINNFLQLLLKLAINTAIVLATMMNSSNSGSGHTGWVVLGSFDITCMYTSCRWSVESKTSQLDCTYFKKNQYIHSFVEFVKARKCTCKPQPFMSDNSRSTSELMRL